MPKYCFYCSNCGNEGEVRMPMSAVGESVYCDICNRKMERNYAAEGVNINPKMVLLQTEMRDGSLQGAPGE